MYDCNCLRFKKGLSGHDCFNRNWLEKCSTGKTQPKHLVSIRRKLNTRGIIPVITDTRNEKCRKRPFLLKTDADENYMQ